LSGLINARLRSRTRRTAITEPDLIARILGGEKDLYAELVREHQAHLYQLCLAFLSDPHEADEAAQVAFIKAYRSLGRFRGGSSFKTWLTRIGINQCKDVLKMRRRSRTLSLDGILEGFKRLPGALVQHPREELPVTPCVPPAVLRGLSDGEKEVVRLVQQKDTISYEEIGRELGLSLDGVKGRLKRAREKMQENLKNVDL
jgi:RNA polymerase sigma-70 factor (ECF subfamily)